MTEKPAGGAAPAAKPRRRRRWLRWLLRIVLALLALLVLLRLLLPFLLPWVANLVLEPQGLQASWRRIELSLLSTHVRLVGLEVRAIAEGDAGHDRAPPPPLAQIADVELDVDAGALLDGEIVVETARIAGLRARLEQTDEGFTLPGLPARPAAEPEPAPEAAPAADAKDPAGPIDFRLPVQVRLLALHDLRVEIADRATGNLQEWRLEAHAETIGVPGKDGAFSLRAICPSALDRLDVIATVRAAERRLQVETEAHFVGAQPQAFAALLAAAGIEPEARRLDGTAKAALTAQTDAAGERAAIEVSAEARVHGDDLVVAAVDRVAATAVLLRDGSLVDAEVEVAGVEAGARVRADGAVVAGGLAFVGGGAGPAEEPEPEPAAGPPAVVAFESILVTDVRARWLDERREPAVDRVVAIPRVEVRSLRIGGEGDAPPATLALALQVPGVLDSLTLDGRLDLQPPRFGVDARLAYEGLHLEAAEPLLTSFGIATGEGTGHGQLALSASVVTDPLRAEVHVSELELHGGGETLAVDQVAITDVAFDASANRVAVGKIAITGPEANVRATQQGIELLRLRFGGAPVAAADAGAATDRSAGGDERKDAPVGTEGPPLRIDLGEITWTGADVTFVDATQPEPLELRLTDLSLSGENWSWGREHGDEDPGRLQLQFSVPGVAERVALRGTVLACDNGTNLDLVLDASGLSIERVRERLRSPGVEPALADGRLLLHVAGQVRAAADALRATLEVTDVDLRDGDATLLQLQRLAVLGFASSNELLAIDRVVVEGPQLRIGRAENGDLLLPGLRLAATPPPARPQTAAGGEQAGGEKTGGERAGGEQAGGEAGTRNDGDRAAGEVAAANGAGGAGESTAGAALRIGEVALEGARVTFLDAVVEPEVAHELVASASLRDLRTGPDADPAPFRVEIASPDLLERLLLEGELQLAAGRTGVTASLDIAGLRGEALSRYLPGLQVPLQDGALQARVAAATSTREDGAGAVRFELTDVALRDGDGEPLLAVDAVRLDAPRIPDHDGLLHIADLAVEGVRGTVRIEPDAIVLPGLRLPRAVSAGPAAPSAAPAEATAARAPEALADATPAPSTSAGEAAVATPKPATPPMRVPLLRIDRLSLELEALTIVDTTAAAPGDGTAPAAAPEPLRIAALITLVESWAMEPVEVAESEPLRVQIEASAAPVLEDVRVALRLSPFAFEPAARVELRVDGIDTKALHRALPSLAGIADGTIENGSFTADASAEFVLRRRSPREFPLGQPFGFTARITDVALRGDEAAAAGQAEQPRQAGNEGPAAVPQEAPPLFAVTSIDVDVNRYDPRTGDLFGNLVEVIGLRGSATQTARGIEVAGIVLAPGAAARRFVAGPPPADAPPPAEVAIDEILLSGLRFTWRDETTTPPTILPLYDLELDILQFSSRATQAPRPMQFTMSVDGGKIDLATRVLGGSIVGDIVSAAGRAIGGGERTTEQRQLFGDFYVTGTLQLYPATVGRVQMNLSGLELQSLGGMASAQGVEIGDGLLDVGAVLEFARSGLDVDAQATFTHLSVTEPPNGPISRVLNLPAPLDTVLFLLRNEAGELRIPIDFHLPQRGLTARQVFGQVVQTLSTVITRAVATSPFRVAGQVTSFADEITGLFGFSLFGGGPPEDLSELSRSIRFRPGVAVAPEHIDDLQAIVERWDGDENIVLVLEHDFGAEDLEIAEQRANPPSVQIEQIAAGLRASVARLEVQRNELAAQVRGLYAAGQLWRAEEQAAELRTLDDRLGTAEIALQQALSRLRPGAETKAARRSRSVALEIAEARLEAVREWLVARAVAAGDPRAAARIEVRKPRYREPDRPVGRVAVRPVFRVAR